MIYRVPGSFEYTSYGMEWLGLFLKHFVVALPQI